MIACQLSMLGIRFRLIDKKGAPSNYSGALIVHAPTLEIFQQMGMAEKAISKGNRINALSIYFNKKKFKIDLKNLGSGLTEFPFMLMIEQSNTEQLLIGFLKEAGHEVEREVELSGFEQGREEVTAFLKMPGGSQETVRARYLIGADGAQSAVRAALGIAFKGKTNNPALCIMDCRAEVDLPPGEVLFSFLNAASAGFFPLPDGRWRIDAAFWPTGQWPAYF